MKLLKVLMIILILTIQTGIADERLEWCEKALWNAKKQTESDKEEIADLYQEIARLVLENETLKVEIKQLENYYGNKLNQQKGLHLGFNFGFPLINMDAIIMYKFDRFGLYVIGGYNQQPNIGLGFLAKIL